MTSRNTYLFTRFCLLLGMWILAAKWEAEENNVMEDARNLLQTGIRFNPESKKLWQEVSDVVYDRIYYK